MDNKILDIEKIGEKSKIELSNLKLVLKEMLKDIRAEEEATNSFKVDISTIIAILENKGIITKDEYESLKDKIDSIIDEMNKIEDAIENGDYSDEAKEEIIKNSNFKGFFPTYEDLLNKIPINKAKHGDYAFVKNFEADTYDINNIILYTFDITYEKWVLSSDLTELRNVHIRDDNGRDGKPLDRDILLYDFVLKRWLNKNFDEADINRKSVFDDHFKDKIELIKDDKNITPIYNKDNGRLIIDINNTDKPNFHPMHIDRNQFNKLLKQIDEDYFTTLHIETETDDLGVERLIITEDDNDEYGNPIQRNVTNKVIRDIINHFYNKLLDTFDIKIDPKTNRILELKDEEPLKYVPKGINTFNIDKIIKAIDNDYNNSFVVDDIKKNSYEFFLNKILEKYNDLNISQEEKENITTRLLSIYGSKELWDHFSDIPEYKKNKNVTPEFFNELIDIINYLYISKDLIRDEIKERDIVINGNRTYTNSATYNNPESIFTINSKLINIDNSNSYFNLNSNNININNNDSTLTINSNNIKIENIESNLLINSKNLEISNSQGNVNIKPNTNFYGNVTISGNLFISDDSNITNIESENTVIKDNIITLNNGETNNIITKGNSGIKIDRGTSDDYFIGYDESRKIPVAGFIENEEINDISNTNQIALITLNELNKNKPLVFNTENKFLENSNYIETNFVGANNIVLNIPNNQFSIFDVVRFDNNNLVKCSHDSLITAEAIGVITDIKENNVTLTISGFIKDLFVPGANNGESLFLSEDGTLKKFDFNYKIHRKIATQIPNGIIIDIQRNNGETGEEIFSEYNYTGILESGNNIIDVGCVSGFNQDTKVFVDGLLLTRGVHYDIDILNSLVVLKQAFNYSVDYNIITNYYMGNAYNLVAENWEIDEIFELPPIYPPNQRYVIATNRDIEKVLGLNKDDEEKIITSNTLKKDLTFVRKTLINSEVLKENDINIKVYTSEGKLFFVSTSEYKRGTFIQINEKGDYVPINNDATNIIGIIQNVNNYKNGLIEYEVNINKIIPYSDISLIEYMNLYEMEFEIGDIIYFKNKINKFNGYKIGQFAKTVFFLEYDKNVYNNPVPMYINNNKEKIIELTANKYYEVEIKSMCIETLELFELDTPNYCRINLINNSKFNIKNMFANFDKDSKRICRVYRNYDKFVLLPLKNVSSKSNITFKEIIPENLIPII